MPLTLNDILAVCSKWYNIVWIMAFALATVETLLFHFATLKLFCNTKEHPSYIGQMRQLFSEIPFDIVVFLLWFLFVALGSYPLSSDTSTVFTKGSDLVLGGFQSLAVSHLILRYVFNREATKGYLLDLFISILFAFFLFCIYYAATKFLNIPTLNLTWFFLGWMSYILIIDRNANLVRREWKLKTGNFTNKMWEDYVLVSQRDGAILFLILCLAINLFPALSKIHDIRTFIAGLAATIIAVVTVTVDYLFQRSPYYYEKLNNLGAERQDDSFAKDFTTYWEYHITIRSLVLLLMGVVLIYNIASFKALADQQKNVPSSSNVVIQTR